MKDPTAQMPQLANLSVAEKRELLKNFLSLRTGGTQHVLPLSFGQQSLWVVYQLAPHSPAYNFLYAARITSELDEAALARACQTLVERHPPLRSTFRLEDGKPVQRILPRLTIDVPITSAQTWSEDELIAHMRQQADQPFDLEHGPVLRIHLYRRQGEHVLLLVFHHIVADLWSMDILVDELQHIYQAERFGHQVDLPPLPAQFADFVRWQFANVYGPRGQKAWEYWQQELSGDLPVLQLPTDHPRPAVQSYNGNAYNWALDSDTVLRLRTLARKHGTTLFVPLLAAFEVLLHRISGQKQFLVGTAVADRGRPEWERLVGYFINQVAMRAHLDGGTTFAAIVERTRDKLHQALVHQDYPFGLIVKRLQPRRDPSHTPVFQVMFIWDKAHDKHAPGQTANGKTRPPLEMSSLLMEQRGAPFDLTLIIFETGDKLTASFRYNTDLFDEQTIVRLSSHFSTLLSDLLHQPETPLAEHALPTPQERRVLLEEWNDTGRPFPDRVCFHKLVEDQAQARPQALALVHDDQQMTYGELNARANRLARHLQTLGVGVGKNVGLCLPRSPATIVAILAAWKAGAAYVPLDPAYPASRLDGMIDDARPAVVLTAGDNPILVLPAGTQRIRLDRIEEELARLSPTNLESTATAADPAYIIFTSGSTGRPKGTVLAHRGLCNMSQAQVEVFQTEPHDRVLQFASLSFDASVFEIAMALRVGACLILPTPGAVLPGEGLLRLLREQKVSNATLPPSVLAALPATDLPDLRTLIVAGEACSAELVSAWGKGRRFFNAYGPTETTVWATVAQCVPDGSSPSIGKPIANTRVYVLDDYLQPVPAGVPGELHISGPGLALGYLQQPGLTADKFIPDPFVSREWREASGEKSSSVTTHHSPLTTHLMYKTGDLVRYRPDGSLEFIGRRDQQVKVNGFRIELEEIQEVLRQHPDVADAVVLAAKTVAKASEVSNKLIAYVVPRIPGKTIDPTEVRAFVRERLPQFMVPTGLAVLDKLPLTISGKVDRAALPDANGENGGGARTVSAAPRNQAEQALAGIWARVLNVQQVGIHDNFFDLGGASIQTLEVASLAKQAGFELAPEMIFQFQTVAELAVHMKGEWRDASGESKTNGHPLTNGEKKPSSGVSLAPRPSPLASRNMIIESLGIYLPPRVVTTEEVVRNCRQPLNFPLERMTGIVSRRMAGDTEFGIDLAGKAIEECLARSAHTAADIDLLICSNISRCDGPDHHFSFEPATSARLHRRFGFTHALAFDVANACAGTFTALAIAESFLKQGLIRRAMVVSGEYITHLTRTAQLEIENFMDSRIACLTLGDSGMALIVEQAENDQIGFHELELYTLGKYHPLCVAKVTDRPHGGAIMYTDPVTSSAVTIKQAVSHSLGVLQRRGWLPDDVKHLILHQTSSTTLDGAIHEVNRVVGREVCTRANTVYNVAERANTATTTHFVALWDQLKQGRIAKGDRILFGISGSGQTVGSALYTMDDLPSRQSAVTERNGTQNGEPRTAECGRHFRLSRRVRIESVGLAGDMPVDTVPMLRAAGTSCLKQSAHSAGDIELVMHAGVYRSEFISEPALAAIAAGELGMNADDASLGERRTFAFDLANGGVGPLDACLVGSQMIAAGKIGVAMILASEIENNARAWPENQLGIQETASGLILEIGGKDEGFDSFWFQSFQEHVGLETYTRGWNNLPALAVERTPDLEERYLACLKTAAKEFLAKEGIDRDQIGLVFPPLRSPDFVRRLADAVEIPLDKFVMPTEGARDAFTSSLPQGMNQARREGRCVPGTIGLVLAVGAGIQVGCAMYRF